MYTDEILGVLWVEALDAVVNRRSVESLEPIAMLAEDLIRRSWLFRRLYTRKVDPN